MMSLAGSISSRTAGTWMGVFGVLLVSFFAFWNRDIARIGEILVFASVLIGLGFIVRDDRSVWVYWVAVAFLMLMVMSNHLAALRQPTEELNHARFLRHYIKMFLFVPFAWCLLRAGVSAFVVFWVFVAGFAVSLLVPGDFGNDVARLLDGQRVDFGVVNAQHLGFIAGVLPIFAVGAIASALRPPISLVKWMQLAALAAVLGLSMILIIGSQARQVWLALVLALPMAGVLSWWARPAAKGWAVAWIALPGLLFMAGAVWLGLQIEPVRDRVAAERETVEVILGSGLADAPVTSIAIRLHQWGYGLELVQQRPLLGHGGATKELLISESGLPERAVKSFGHFHNSYIELGVAYGLAAPTVFLILMGVLVWNVWRARSVGALDFGGAFFGYGFVIYFAVVNVFESYVMYRTGYTVLAVFGGLVLVLTAQKQNERSV